MARCKENSFLHVNIIILQSMQLIFFENFSTYSPSSHRQDSIVGFLKNESIYLLFIFPFFLFAVEMVVLE